jgi:hypothetical protein
MNLYIPLMTDNQGNAYSLLNASSKKCPCSAILMELMWLIHSHNMVLGAQHVYRELNQWADDLSNGQCDDFVHTNRIDQKKTESSWTLLPQLMQLHQK